MTNILHWLGRNKIITVLLGIAVYFCIVTFHDEVTTLVIKIRNSLGLELFNSYLAYGFLALLIFILIIFFYQSLKSRQKILKSVLSLIVSAMMIISFRLLMVYNIEAIHFVEYMLVAIILLPVIRSYGETVFWVTILGMLDELFQYRFLTPDFEYFDFNDSTLNLLGAGAGALLIFVLNDNAIEIRRIKWYRSPAVLTGLGLLTVFLVLLISQKISINPVETPGTWFSVNRVTLPDDFWKEAYPGRRFHILRPIEGIMVMILLFAGFSMLDLSVKPQRRTKDFTKAHKD